ncbi:MAG: hypothetical protein Q9186_004709 [Xanthomendoza sp. 1 TL-2023]
MGRTGALISGSLAIQFFERCYWPSSDLDIFVKDGDDSKSLGQYLVSSEGYRLKEIKGPPTIDYVMSKVVTIRKYTRLALHAPDTEIHVISTTDIPVQAILGGFYTTLVVNIISWNRAYSIFALTTFVQYRGYLLKETKENDYFVPLVTKYTRRGWDIRGILARQDHRINHPIQQHRRLADKYTWRISFDVSKVEWSQTPDSVLEHACFDIHDGDADHEYYGIGAFTFKSPALRFTYTYHYSWCQYLGVKVSQMVKGELRKMKPEDRPPNYQFFLDRPDDLRLHHQSTISGPERYHRPVFGDIYRPDTWTYWDSEIPQWYEAWEKEHASASSTQMENT